MERFCVQAIEDERCEPFRKKGAWRFCFCGTEHEIKQCNACEPLEDAVAKARLADAAPELLRACEITLDALACEFGFALSFEQDCVLTAVKKLLREAIAKAKVV